MFADYLNEHPWDNRSHRGWTTLASFALQAFALSILLLLPMLYTSRLPALQAVGALVLPVPAPAPYSIELRFRCDLGMMPPSLSVRVFGARVPTTCAYR